VSAGSFEGGRFRHEQEQAGRMIGSIISAVVGGVIATVTVVGIVTHGVNAAPSNPGDVNANIPYGSTQ
jgi:hypothetical protein